MKLNRKKITALFKGSCLSLAILSLIGGSAFAQDSTTVAQPEVKEVRLAKRTFESVLVLDNQTVIVPKKGSMEMFIQHRFGTVNNGVKDMFGLFAPSNIRLGINYVPIKRFNIGIGLAKERMQLDLNAKYALLLQTESHKMPVSVSYFANIVMDTREKSNFSNNVDRYSYFNQLMVARKFTDRFSAQISGNFSWFNNVEGYINSKGEVVNKMNNGHFSFSLLGRYKFSDKSSIVANYDQPLTQHLTNNPHPNISFGLETVTDSHAFQVFVGNYSGIVPQSDNVFNQNDYTKGQFVIGFNITRLWAF